MEIAVLPNDLTNQARKALIYEDYKGNWINFIEHYANLTFIEDWQEEKCRWKKAKRIPLGDFP